MQRLVAVATSGGRDSTALLHATCRAAAGLGIEVLALHVHHGLMPDADAWCGHLRRQCARWARAGLPVRLRIHRVQTRPQRGDSIEAWARRERYLALGAMAHEEGAGIVLLAHHRRDQAETFLLQALRGAGAAGLAAMPRQVERDGLRWCRPWLAMPRAAIDAYVRRFRLVHVEDGSNLDSRFARGRLRKQLWPALESSFADAETALANSANRAHEAAVCLQELAESDLATCATDGTDLAVPDWLRLSPARRANTLRAWLARTLNGGVPDSLVQRLIDEVPNASTGASWPTAIGPLRLHRKALQWATTVQQAAAGIAAQTIDLSKPGDYPLPAWGGTLRVSTTAQGGLPMQLLREAELRARTGGEHFQRAARSTPRSLKKAYQALGLGVDDRSGPLLYIDDQLAFVPGLGIDARWQFTAAEPSCLITWHPGA